MSQESEQAQEAWRLKATGLNPWAGRHLYLDAIKDYKAALKAEIEKMLIKMPYNAAHSRLCDVLSLLDTVKPL